MTTPATAKPAIRVKKYADPVSAVRRVRDSHQAVIDAIATHAEKHRLEMNAKRDAIKANNALMAGSQNAGQ